jgi:hypothetical protein
MGCAFSNLKNGERKVTFGLSISEPPKVFTFLKVLVKSKRIGRKYVKIEQI